MSFKKHSFLLSLFLLSKIACYCQTHFGDNWVFGDSVQLNFTNITPVLLNQYVGRSLESTTSLSDSVGNILFYVSAPTILSATFNVYNSNNAIITNGSNLVGDGSCSQGSLLIPYDSIIFILTNGINLGNGVNHIYLSKLLNTDISDSVFVKNVLLTTDSLSEQMCAIKHANGRDWWLIIPNYLGDLLEFLITPTGITVPTLLPFYPHSPLSRGGMLVTDKLGIKLIFANPSNILNLYNFDRCGGYISLIDTLDYYNSNLYLSYYGTSFSPDGSKLYVSTTDSLFRFDLNAPDIKQSKTLLFVTPNDTFDLGQHKLGRDGKIYIANAHWAHNSHDSLCTHLTVIENPDSLNCIVKPYSFSLDGHQCHYGMPNIPNYDLGPLSGSICDSLTTALPYLEEKNKLNVFPNPADEKTTINFNTSKHENCLVKVFDITGKEIFDSQTTSNSFEINCKEFDSGFYEVNLLIDNSQKIYRAKLVIVH